MRNKIFLVFSICLMFSCSIKKSEDTFVVVPENYTGTVLIIFNQINGESRKYEGKKRVYEISQNGILKTKFEPQFGYHFQKFYFLKNNDRIEIPAIFQMNDKIKDSLASSERLYAFGFEQSGKVEKYNPETLELISVKEPAFYFFIGKIEEYDSSFQKMLKFSFDNRNDE